MNFPKLSAEWVRDMGTLESKMLCADGAEGKREAVRKVRQSMEQYRI